MPKQLSLGAFGFTKTVTNKDGKPEFRDISTVAEKPKAYTCEILVKDPDLKSPQ